MLSRGEIQVGQRGCGGLGIRESVSSVVDYGCVKGSGSWVICVFGLEGLLHWCWVWGGILLAMCTESFHALRCTAVVSSLSVKGSVRSATDLIVELDAALRADSSLHGEVIMVLFLDTFWEAQ